MRALKSVAALFAVSFGVQAGGCSEEAAQPLNLEVGGHRVVFDAPQAWQHFDKGAEQFFKRDFDQIFLNDAGIVTVGGFRTEVERAREVFRGGSLEQANDMLNALRWRSSFPSIDRWEAFATSLNRARGLGDRRQHHDPDVVESAYTEMLVQLAALPERDIATLAAEVLGDFEPVDRRTIRDQGPMTIDGRRAWRIETWDRLNHIQRMRYIFVLDEGRFLVIRTGLGKLADIEPTFERIVASLRFEQ